MNKKTIFTTIIISALILSACNIAPAKKTVKTPSKKVVLEQDLQVDNGETEKPVETKVVSESEGEEDSLSQPTTSQSTELDDLEQELNDTQIPEEDFSDL